MNDSYVIYGGTFDPPTAAHARLVRDLSGRFARVIVVPCKVSPFKTITGARAAERLEMLGMIADGVPHTDICTFELEREGTDYTYLTLEHFRREYPDKKLYLCMGSEMVIELERWRNTDVIARCATLYIVPRPHFPLTDDMIAKIKALGMPYEIADFNGEYGSSSEVRISVAMGKPDMFLTERVAEYAAAHGLYRDYCYVNGLYERFGMKKSRIEHSFSTALCGVCLAKRACVDTHKATTALLLHDIGKYVTKEEAEKMGVRFDGRIDGMPLPIRHAEIGAEILRQIVGIKDEDIIEAVRWHTTGKPDMTPLEKIVYLADYIEPLRSFPTVDKLREATERSIDEGLRAALANSVEHVGADELYPATVEAYEFYKETK